MDLNKRNERLDTEESCGIWLKGATEPLFSEAEYYKKKEGLGSPQWHSTTSVLLTGILLLKNVLLKKSNFDFSKYLKKTEKE